MGVTTCRGRLPPHPLPLGERGLIQTFLRYYLKTGAVCPNRLSVLYVLPHPNPLPKGEGTFEIASQGRVTSKRKEVPAWQEPRGGLRIIGAETALIVFGKSRPAPGVLARIAGRMKYGFGTRKFLRGRRGPAPEPENTGRYPGHGRHAYPQLHQKAAPAVFLPGYQFVAVLHESLRSIKAVVSAKGASLLLPFRYRVHIIAVRHRTCTRVSQLRNCSNLVYYQAGRPVVPGQAGTSNLCKPWRG